MSSVTIVESYPQNKRSTIAIRPYFDSGVDNMGLQKYGLSLFEGAFHEEQLACLEINGIKRYVTGLNEFAPEVKELPLEEQEAKIKEIRRVISYLEKALAANVVEPDDKDFWNKITLLRPNNSELWDKIKIRVGNEAVYLEPDKDPYDLIKLYAIEAGGFSMVAKSLEEDYPDEDITELTIQDLEELIKSLEDFEDNEAEVNKEAGLEKTARIYQASSSEMFGKVRETPQNELTPFHPRSPYGVAKTFAHYSCVNYREAYDMHISCGILFNHEGERRGHEFVTRKISSTVAKIKLGKADELRLGTLTPRRDWGYAGDYVEAMHLMTQQEEADDFVIATGETHSVEEFVDLAFEIAEIANGKERYVKIDKEFQRPSEVDLLVGDPTKAMTKLGWKPKYNLAALIKEMVASDIALFKKDLFLKQSGL
jgi:FeS assembly protein IscX